jgi:hypothetical protein
MRVLGKDRMREIFISDSEDSILPPEPVITSKYVLNFREILMNQLAMSRYDGLIKRQPISIFNDMNFKVTPQTTFIFL